MKKIDFSESTISIKIVMLALATFMLSQCGSIKDSVKDDLGSGVFFCDAEALSFNGDKFISYGYKFGGGKGQSTDEAYEGKFSCMVDTSNKYGMTHIFKDLKPLEVFNVSVYRKGKGINGTLVIQSSAGTLYKAALSSFQKKDNNGWDVLSINMQLPQNVDSLKGLKVYVHNGQKDGQKVYFDNLSIHRFSRTPSDSVTIDNDAFSIELTDYDYNTIKSFREQAIKQTIISKKLKKAFSGLLKYKGETFRIGIRLKGDWTDHLQGDKWSFRINVKDGQTIMGLKSFSIQSPMVRDYLQEWVIHKACDREGVLTTNFDYVPVAINGINFGLYNVEEHFNKQLLESRNRREGVILKISEEGYWEKNLYEKKHEVKLGKPFYESAIISTFNSKKVNKSEKLRGQFLIAQNLMLKYKNGAADVANFLDIDAFAKTMALMNLGNVYHSYIWHNQRFYYNPIASKLEMIVYDCYSRPGHSLSRAQGIAGNLSEGIHQTDPGGYVVKNVFDNPTFQKAYLSYLKRFSSKEYVMAFVEDIRPKVDSLSSKLKEEYSFYNYDYGFIESNAKKIRAELLNYESKVKKGAIAFELKKNIENDCHTAEPFKHISLNVYLNEVKQNGTTLLKLQSYHCLPIAVIGYSTKKFPDSLISISKGVKLGSFPKDKKTYSLSLSEKPKKLFYKVEGDHRDTVYSSKLIPWPIPTMDLAFDKAETTLSTNSKVYDFKNDSVIFKKGKHIITESIVIPSEMEVVFESGAHLVLNNNSFFLSYSAVKMIGKDLEPIKISSTDGSGAGFTVLEAEKASYIKRVIFDGLNTFNQNGWTLTGAVTFYESEVEIDSTIFKNNTCEDGLNIIRSSFKLSNSEISNTYSDGFDADFCEGSVVNCSFNNTGNDCLDFSGSTVTVKDCSLNNSGDKGISCGEASTITIRNIYIDKAILGVASKDNSVVIVNNIQLTNCETGFSAFQKKSEYGPSKIAIDAYVLEGVVNTAKQEKGSIITLQNKLKDKSLLKII